MDVTIWSVPFSIGLLAVAFFLWKRAKAAESIPSRYEPYVLAAGTVSFVLIGWVGWWSWRSSS